MASLVDPVDGLSHLLSKLGPATVVGRLLTAQLILLITVA